MWNSFIFIQENAFENVVCEMASISSRPQWVKCNSVTNYEQTSLINMIRLNFDLNLANDTICSYTAIRLSLDNRNTNVLLINHDFRSLEFGMRANNLTPLMQKGNYLEKNMTAHYSGIIMSAMASQITSVLIVYSNVCSGADQRKYQSSAPMACVGEFTANRWIPRTNG